MPQTVVSYPILELLTWLDAHPRTYGETMDAWTTHCPRLSTWEDALSAELIEVTRNGSGKTLVALTATGDEARDHTVM